MNPSVALPARRISDLLSSGLGARAKSKRDAMDQPRTDEDQELVSAHAIGRCQRVRSTGDQIYAASLRLGLQHDLEPRGHERSFAGYFFQGLQSDPRVSAASRPFTPGSIRSR